MPWKVSGVVEQRMRFVVDHEGGLWTMAELCRRYETSRETGYKWVDRFQQDGAEGLVDRSRAPARHPNQTSAAAVAERILELRREHPTWGLRKLQAYLERKWPQNPWPAASTIGELLHREGLTLPRRKRRHAPRYTQPFVAIDGAVCCGLRSCAHSRRDAGVTVGRVPVRLTRAGGFVYHGVRGEAG